MGGLVDSKLTIRLGLNSQGHFLSTRISEALFTSYRQLVCDFRMDLALD
jgi:hypothetical protein